MSLLELGRTLQLRYRIEVLLDAGGFGEVYLARHLHLDTVVAVKVLQFVTSNPEHQHRLEEQFRREARILGGLDHRNIAKVTDSFEEDGKFFLVMEYVEGLNLHEVIRTQGPLSPDTAVYIAHQILDALSYIHNRTPPIIMRDLKPANVMVGADWRVRLIDFGLAKEHVHGIDTHSVIHSARSEGFAPLEQYGASTDARSDYYALGATLYFTLTGTAPPSAIERATRKSKIYPLADKRPDIGVGLETAVMTLLEIFPEDRPSSPDEIRKWLSSTVIHDAQATQAPKPSPPPPRARSIRRIVPEFKANTASAKTDSSATQKKARAENEDKVLARRRILALLACLLWVNAIVYFIAQMSSPNPTEGMTSSSLGSLPAIVVKGLPSNSQVLVSGETVGNSPLEHRVTSGEYEIEIRKEGYLPYKTHVRVSDLSADVKFTLHPKIVKVLADGKGYYPSLQEAVKRCPPGVLIQLGTGTHQLSDTLAIERDLQVSGQGMGRTKIVGASPALIEITDTGALKLHGVDLVFNGKPPGDVIHVNGGSLDIAECSVAGAKWEKKGNVGGSGIIFTRSPHTMVIQKCRFTHNEHSGIYAGSGSPQISECSFIENDCGVVFFESAQGDLFKSSFVRNNFSIITFKTSHPHIRNNKISECRFSAIECHDSSRPIITENEFFKNTAGIFVFNKANPIAKANQCHHNKCGICVTDQASGSFERNVCTANSTNGIQILESGLPTLVNNTCTFNMYSGILYIDHSGGTARRNTCSENGSSGIDLQDSGHPTLVSNTCTVNRYSGIRYVDHSGGTARGNTCTENGSSGIFVSSGCSPEVEGNTCWGNPSDVYRE